MDDLDIGRLRALYNAWLERVEDLDEKYYMRGGAINSDMEFGAIFGTELPRLLDALDAQRARIEELEKRMGVGG